MDGRARDWWRRVAGPRGFSLPRSFALTGGLVFLLGVLLLSHLVRESSYANLRWAAQQNNATLAMALSNALAEALAAEGPEGELDRRVRRVIDGTGVAKVKIYDLAGRTRYSSDPAQIGEDQSGNAGFRAALAGGTASDLVFRDEFSAFEGVVFDRDLMSSYIPVRLAPGAEVSHVFEIYSDVTAFKREIEAIHRREGLIAGGAFLAVYLVAVAIVTIGHRRLRREQAAVIDLTAAVARAEAASDAQSVFLMQMSHELRTPLNAIIGFAELIRDDDDGSTLARRHADFAAELHGSATMLLRRFNDALELVRLDSGKAVADVAATDLHAVVRSAVAAVIDAGGLDHIALDIDCPAALPAPVTDARRLRQILVNLLGNAVKFTPAGGTVTLRVRPGARGGVVIVVADTGIGIAPEDLPRCLSPFGQADGDHRRRQQGFGLGLPLAVRLTRLLGGELRLDSSPGRGTHAAVYLPGQAPAYSAATPALAGAAARRSAGSHSAAAAAVAASAASSASSQ